MGGGGGGGGGGGAPPTAPPSPPASYTNDDHSSLATTSVSFLPCQSICPVVHLSSFYNRLKLKAMITMYDIAESDYFGGARFGGGSGPIWMSDLTCAGTEASLFSCTSNTPLGSVQNTTSCTHSNDVSVRCSGYSPGNLTLVLLLLIPSISIIL